MYVYVRQRAGGSVCLNCESVCVCVSWTSVPECVCVSEAMCVCMESVCVCVYVWSVCVCVCMYVCVCRSHLGFISFSGAHSTKSPPILPRGPINRAGCVVRRHASVGSQMR